MPKLSDAEIYANAAKFAREHAGVTRENAESQTFWNDFLAVFGVDRRIAGFYEFFVKLDRIDLFIPGKLVVEQKSRDTSGKKIKQAEEQVRRYLSRMAFGDVVKDSDFPRYSLVCDFHQFVLSDIQTGQVFSFTLPELPENIGLFSFLHEVSARPRGPLSKVDKKAVDAITDLQKALEKSKYPVKYLPLLMTRIVFCLFAEHTQIFSKGSFTDLVDGTEKDGKNLGDMVSKLFQVLDRPVSERDEGLDSDLDAFRYINGGLFADIIPSFTGNANIRRLLLRAGEADWSSISPAVFGSIFQNVLAPKQMRESGAHYTSEANILLALNPVIFDPLWKELETIKELKVGQKEAALAFQRKLATLVFFDPACGCGNFLVVSYMAIRSMEIEVLKIAYGHKIDKSLVPGLSMIDVDHFHGIEIMPHAVRIAEVAMWMVDHLMNLRLSKAFGVEFMRIPLRAKAKIHLGDAQAIDWASVAGNKEIEIDGISYPVTLHQVGNPPYIGAKKQAATNQSSLARTRNEVFSRLGLTVPKTKANVDFSAAWLWKAVELQRDRPGTITFILTNSVSQGQQVAGIWPAIHEAGFEIVSAHQSFPWQTRIKDMTAGETRAAKQASVIVVAVTLQSKASAPSERLLHALDENGIWTETVTRQITPYLTDGSMLDDPWIIVKERKTPLNPDMPRLLTGNQPIDKGNLILKTQAEYDEVIKAFPAGTPQADIDLIVRPFIGAREVLHGKPRHILYLGDDVPNAFLDNPVIMERLKKVRAFRQKSKRPETLKLANTPRRYGNKNVVSRQYIGVPNVTSGARKYIPMILEGAADGEIARLPSNLLLTIDKGESWLLGLLMSSAHMDWMRMSCGRLKSDYRYSTTLAYNTFPWPERMGNKVVRDRLASLANKVLDARPKDITLAKAYIDIAMNEDLRNAHAALDRYVDSLYGNDFSAVNRIGRLLSMYEQNVRARDLADADAKKAKKKKGSSKDVQPSLF